MAGAGPTLLAAAPAGAGEAPGWWRDRAAAQGGRELAAGARGRVFALPGVPAALAVAKEIQAGGTARVGVDAGGEDARAGAAELCARAEPGQVLVSARARALVPATADQELRELPRTGGDDQGRAWELLWREPEPRTRIRLCGPLRLEVDGRDLAPSVPAGQPGVLLRYLLAAQNRAADRDELLDVVWPERAPRDPQAALRPILSRLRTALGAGALEGRARIRVVLPEPVWVDVDDAARAIAAARAAAKGAAWGAVRDHARSALELLEPGFLPSLQADWADERRRELEELELEALEWLARSALAGDAAELAAAESASRRLIARAPYRETGHRFLMEALARSGNAAEALRVYDELRVLLRDELGAAPAAEVQALHVRLLAGDAPGPPSSPRADRPAPAVAKGAPLPRLLGPGERSAIVGREPELALLRAAWDAARGGARRLVLLAGEPGIGKTRLAGELAVEAHREGTVLYAGCQQEALIPYQPFVEALQHHLRSPGFEAASAPLGAGAHELARLIPELAAALPAPTAAEPDDPETRRWLMFEAVSDLLTAATARAPLLLVLDDLDWADRATLQLLRHVIRAPHEAALLIVGTYREGEIGPEHPLAALLADTRRDRLFDRIVLSGLDAPGVGELIVSHAGHEAPSGVVEAVHERTDGNPFFVEEVLRHLIESGVLFERGGRWVSALTVDEMGVPAGVREVLLRRLARLSGDCRSVLAKAAVLGREFCFDVLAAMAERGEDALLAALEEAVGAQLVVEARAEAGAAFGFTHALVREALYGELSAPRRQRMHAQAAAAIEAVQGEAPLAALAVHHRRAGSAGDPAKAVGFSLRAGQAARELLAWDEAAAHWSGALAVLARTGGSEPERARLLVALADLMVVVGDLPRQIESLEQALALYEGLGDDERAAHAHSRLGMAHSLIDSIESEHLDLPRAFAHFDAARRVLDRGPVRRARGHLETGVSSALSYGLRMQPGIEAASRAMDVAEAVGDELLWAGGAEAYGWHKIVAGELREGFETVERAFAVADRRQRSFLAWMGANIRGQLTWGLGAPDEAQAFFERPLTLAYVGTTAYRQQIADGLGRCHVSRGELDEARRRLADAKPAWVTHALEPLVGLWDGRWDDVAALARRVLETSRRTGNRWDEFASLHLAARVHHLRGAPRPAAALLDDALGIVVDGGARYFELWVRPDLARVCAGLDRLEEARRHVERCRAIVGRGEDWRGRAGHVSLAHAVVLAREDRTEEAHAAFAAAQDAFARHALRGDVADALHQWGRALARAGDRTGAIERLEQARDVYVRCGAAGVWAERVDGDLRRLRTGQPGALRAS